MKRLSTIAIVAFGSLALANFALAQDWPSDQLSLRSKTFENNGRLPLSMIYNYQYNGTNICSLGWKPRWR
jgi:hypothetical protein